MANHRSRAQFDRARWRVSILAPAWILQLAISFAVIGLFSWRLSDTLMHFEDQHDGGTIPTMEFIWEVANIALSLVIVGCTCFEMIRYYAETLTPWTMLFTHIVKLACAIAILVLDILIYIKKKESKYTFIGLGLDAVNVISAVVLAIYAILAYRRLSKYDNYAHPANVKSFGFNDGLERDSFSSKRALRPSLDVRKSSVSSRLSIGSRKRSTSETLQIPLDGLERTPSYYSHQRDTQFDEYRARRSSNGSWTGDANRPSLDGRSRSKSGGSHSSLKLDADRVMDAEFGWSDPPAVSPDDSSLRMGTVNTSQPGSIMPRTPSCVSDHVLMSVPEEEGDIGDQEMEESSEHEQDQRALLSDTQRGSPGQHGDRLPGRPLTRKRSWQDR